MSWALEARRLYLCTPDRPDLATFVDDCISGGVDIVQLRDKFLEAKPLLARAALAQRVCADHGVPFIFNDRPDLALQSGADGVHVGQDDAPVPLVRRIVGPDALVGLSTHSIADLDGSLHEEVDYFSAGPVVATPTKPGRRGTGLDYLRYATAKSDKPVFVTGGVTPDNIAELAAAGARHFVVVRFLTESDDPRAAARRLYEQISRSVGEESRR